MSALEAVMVLDTNPPLQLPVVGISCNVAKLLKPVHFIVANSLPFLHRKGQLRDCRI
jgi:hypothetical protein